MHHLSPPPPLLSPQAQSSLSWKRRDVLVPKSLALTPARVYEGGNGGDTVRSCPTPIFALPHGALVPHLGEGSGASDAYFLRMLHPRVLLQPPQVQGKLMVSLCIPMREELTCCMK